MVDVLEAILKGLAMGLLLVISVGPVIFTIIKQSINNGKEGGFSFVIGVWVSDLLLVVLSNVFSEIVTRLLDFKKPIGITGSLFLIAMGVHYLFFKKVPLHPEDVSLPPLKASDHAKIAIQGFLLNTLNPAVIAFWLTAATAIAVTHTVKERIIIFTTTLLINMSADVAKVKLAGKLRSKLTVHNIRLINKISGLILLIFGTVLLLGVLFFVKKHLNQ
ncbi:lysine transporter LysE [Ginsengibacter hankyongi]|uniref:Lysine transporter LysE n=1 Tax=Ginsengibacter hankyongi TaxID=2607284 RepID=A0A5J5IMH5_9BACT|nr:LysE family transporter [Ginsengibacter hankyongi]KAA9041951.1 lysine transporter LysE [Ginsengibacter hankyongi]